MAWPVHVVHGLPIAVHGLFTGLDSPQKDPNSTPPSANLELPLIQTLWEVAYRGYVD